MSDRPAKKRIAARTACAAIWLALSFAPALMSSCSLFATSPCGSSSECAGNACVEGFCTDAPGEEDSGHVVADAGRADDDAGSAPGDGGGLVDGGSPPDDDAGNPLDDDAGSAPVDGGTAVDAGNLSVDGGNASVDGGNASVDGGNALVDGGNVAEDAGDVGLDAGNAGGLRDAGPPAFPVATGCAGVATTETCANDDTLVLCVPFDDPPVDGGFETLEDRSQANHPVTPSNVGIDVGIEGPGARFHGSSDVVVSDDDLSLAAGSALSYEAWFFAEAPAGVAMQVIERDEQYYVELSPNGAGWDVYCGIAMPVASNNVRLLAGTVSASAWHHVACTWISGTFSAYADGVIGAAVDTGSAAAPIGATTFVLGRNNPSATKPFFGVVNRVRVWARQLTDEEVRCAAAAEVP